MLLAYGILIKIVSGNIRMGNLFDFDRDSSTLFYEKEGRKLERLRSLDEKIADAINRVRTLKEEKQALERRVRELEMLLNEKNEEIEKLKSEKVSVKGQIEDLLKEIESLEIV